MGWPWSKKKQEWTPEVKETRTHYQAFWDIKNALSKLSPTAKMEYLKFKPIMTDAKYRIPADPHDVISRCPKDRFSKHKADENDCDDRVRIFRGWMSENGWGNILAMSCKIIVPGTGPQTGAHAVIAFVHEGRLLFGEPAQGKIVDFPGAKIERIIA